jgi:hypothetical protein
MDGKFIFFNKLIFSKIDLQLKYNPDFGITNLNNYKYCSCLNKAVLFENQLI